MSLRDQYLLDPSVTFLNHGSFGAPPRVVFDEYQYWQREFERQPVLFVRRAEGLLDHAREILGRYLNVPADEVIYLTNATHAVNVLARSLALRPGDEVLTTNLEYGACDRTWEYELAKRGVTYRKQPIRLPATTPEAMVDDLWRGVTPSTKVIYLSHITSGTALTLPVEVICARARADGIFTVIDGAHVPGHLPLDLAAIGADVYTGNLHKWLSAPRGSAFLHVRPEHHVWVEGTIVSWGWVEESTYRRAEVSELVNRNQWQGTRDIAPFLAVPAAIAFQDAHDWPVQQEQCHRLAVRALDEIVERWGGEPLSPVPDPGGFPWFRQMVACPLPPVDAPLLKRRMYDEFLVEAPVTVFEDRAFLRLSFQAYNDERDLARALEALAALLPEVRAS